MTFDSQEQEQLEGMKNAFTSREKQWWRGMVYFEGVRVKYDGVVWERVFEGIGYTPPPDCVSGWRRVG